jgi:NAD(P)H-hydrate epimerase
MDTHPDTTQFIFDLLSRQRKPVVLDADGINALEGEAARLEDLEVPVIITPHSGELARLVSKEIPSEPLERIEMTRKIAQKLGITLLHKGAPTLLASPGGEVWINQHGNSALATAGTGDVLTGLIGGMVAQGAEPLDAAAVGCYLHSRAAEEAAFDLGLRGVIAGDLLEYVGLPMLELEANETII